MTQQSPDDAIDFSIDPDNLYREESYTDLQVGAIRRLIPVHLDGAPDKRRTEVFIGSTQLMTPEGPLPVQTHLMANNFKEAVQAFPGAMAAAVDEMIRELQKLAEAQKRQSDSRIIVP